MLGKRIRIRRGARHTTAVAPASKPDEPTRITNESFEKLGAEEGWAVYQVRSSITLEDRAYAIGERVILPYAESFYKNPYLLMLRVIEP